MSIPTAWPSAALFLMATLALAWLFRACLRRPRSHGFYRFFALESLLLLALLNGPYWFVDRSSPPQLLSWLLLAAALYLVLHGRWLLSRYGQHDPQRADPALLPFEKTRHLVCHGLYAHIRHPMYASLMLLAWGLYLKQPGALAAGLATTACVLLAVTAHIEEGENRAFFGPAYADYQRRSKRFLPGLF